MRATKKQQRLQRPQRIVRKAPLTSEIQYQRTRKEINATNRRRAKDMERRVAKYLRGDRTPMSGAGAKNKGDVTVDFTNNPGKYIIECKLSSDRNKDDTPQIAIYLIWLAKLQQEALAMRAKFAILVIHYHRISQDYALVRSDHVDWILSQKSNITLIKHPERDMIYFSNGKRRSLYTLSLKELSILDNITDYQVIPYHTPDGLYYLFTLTQWRDFIEGI